MPHCMSLPSTNYPQIFTFQLIAATLLIISGECLKNCFEIIYHIPGRMLLGCAYAIAHIAVISYASEATTNSIRTGLLSSIAFVNAVSTMFTVALVQRILNLDEYKSVTNSSANETLNDTTEYPIEINQTTVDVYVIVSFFGIVIMAAALLAIVLAVFINRESIPFLVCRTKYVQAYDEFLILHSSSKNVASNLLSDFEIWKNNILLQSECRKNILKTENVQSLQFLLSARLLNVLYNSIFMSIISIHHMNLIVHQRYHDNGNHLYDHSNQEDVLNLLLTVKASAFIFGLILCLIGLKWNTDRYYFIISLMWSLGALLLYLAYSCFYHLLDHSPPAFMEYFVFYILLVYLMISFKIEMFYYQQISKIYHETNNNYKIWSLVFVECSAYFMHILLILNVFLLNSFSALVTDFGIIFISLWFVKEARRDVRYKI